MRRRFAGVSNEYLTIKALAENVSVSITKEVYGTIMFSVNDDDWEQYSGVIILSKGDEVRFKGNLSLTAYQSQPISFSISDNVELSGDCTSILKNRLLFDSCFYNTFFDSPIVSVSKNFLPSTTLAVDCYCSMFAHCTSLVTAPELPATTLANSCYNSMFYGCRSLTTAPELPATTLANSCYYNMFQGCTSLVTAPELPATILTNYCYTLMFYGCTSLTTVPDLPATTLASDCYREMFQDCTSLTTATELPATTLASGCYMSMFYNCRLLVKAPELPATTLASNCYQYMFYNCSKLNYVKAMFTTTPGSSYTNSWLYGVASTGTFVKNKYATWNVTGSSGIPSSWTVQTA